MRKLTALLSLCFAGCMGNAMITAANRPITITGATPKVVSARGGTTVVLKGSGFEEGVVLQVDGIDVPLEFINTTEARFVTPTLHTGKAPVVVWFDVRFPAELVGGLTVETLDLRFVQAPPHSLVIDETTGLGSAGLADVDDDGDVDLLACGEKCQLLYNDGRANFLPIQAVVDAGAAVVDAGASDASVFWDAGVIDAGVKVAMPQAATVIALMDLDRDGDNDLLSTTSDGGLLLENDRGFTVAPNWVFPRAQAVALGDLDGDGFVDLVAVIDGTLQVGTNRSSQLGTKFVFPETTVVSADGGTETVDAGVAKLNIPTTRSLTLADIEGDGDLDVIAATTEVHDGVTLRLFLNDHGALTEVPGGLPGSPVVPVIALAAGDVDGNGSVDLIAVTAGQDRLLLNDGSAHFFDATTAAFPVDNSNGTSIALIDLDLDRDLDVVVGNAGATTRLYLNDGVGRFSDHTLLLPVAAQNVTQVSARDFDGDGDLDLLVLPTTARDAQIYLSVEPRP